MTRNTQIYWSWVRLLAEKIMMTLGFGLFLADYFICKKMIILFGTTARYSLSRKRNKPSHHDQA